jgi:hypothetical protein
MGRVAAIRLLASLDQGKQCEEAGQSNILRRGLRKTVKPPQASLPPTGRGVLRLGATPPCHVRMRPATKPSEPKATPSLK